MEMCISCAGHTAMLYIYIYILQKLGPGGVNVSMSCCQGVYRPVLQCGQPFVQVSVCELLKPTLYQSPVILCMETCQVPTSENLSEIN